MPKNRWSEQVEPLLRLRTLNAAWYHDLLRLLPGDEVRINDWYERQKVYLHQAASASGYDAVEFDKLTILQKGD